MQKLHSKAAKQEEKNLWLHVGSDLNNTNLINCNHTLMFFRCGTMKGELKLSCHLKGRTRSQVLVDLSPESLSFTAPCWILPGVARRVSAAVINYRRTEAGAGSWMKLEEWTLPTGCFVAVHLTLCPCVGFHLSITVWKITCVRLCVSAPPELLSTLLRWRLCRLWRGWGLPALYSAERKLPVQPQIAAKCPVSSLHLYTLNLNSQEPVKRLQVFLYSFWKQLSSGKNTFLIQELHRYHCLSGAPTSSWSHLFFFKCYWFNDILIFFCFVL